MGISVRLRRRWCPVSFAKRSQARWIEVDVFVLMICLCCSFLQFRCIYNILNFQRGASGHGPDEWGKIGLSKLVLCSCPALGTFYFDVRAWLKPIVPTASAFFTEGGRVSIWLCFLCDGCMRMRLSHVGNYWRFFGLQFHWNASTSHSELRNCIIYLRVETTLVVDWRGLCLTRQSRTLSLVSDLLHVEYVHVELYSPSDTSR